MIKENMRVVLDTTYLLPAFGVEIKEDTNAGIVETLSTFLERGGSIIISDLTPLEALLKVLKIAEKRSELRDRAKEGFIMLWQDRSFEKIPHSSEDVFLKAYEIMKKHRDPFDCFIFATAIAEKLSIVTEDEASIKYLEKDKVMNWEEFKKSVIE